MINANKAFESQIKKVNYVDITLRDGTVLNLEPSDLSLGQFSMKDETTTGKFEIGSAIGKTISLTIANHTEKFSMYDFYKSIVYVYVSVTLEDGTVLKERKGKYYVIEPSTTGEVINISGVDSMYLFDKPYNANTVYPATLQSILSDCCLDCGVTIGFKQFDNYNFIVKEKPTDCTYRQVVSWVAQIAGYNARISNDDKLELVWHTTVVENYINGGNFVSYSETEQFEGGNFKDYEDTILIDGGYYTDPSPEKIVRIKNLKISTDDVFITGVKVENGKTSVLVGTEDYCVVVKENELSIGNESSIAQHLAGKIIGLKFRPLTCEIPNNPLYEPFDSCYVYDRKGNSYFTIINSVIYTINGLTTLSCKADSVIRNESSYISESAKAVAKAKKETSDMLTTYDKAVQNMNMLASNSMGLYRDSELLNDGSVIYYQSNRPITKNDNGKCSFVENSVVYKMTGDGFFVSVDGGKSYTNGFDSQGNAVVNVLSAIGITFDWAKGGTLTLGGSDNINGSMNVLDKDGNVVGKFNNEGLWAENGYFKGIIKSKDAEITGGYINIETSSLEYSAIKLSYNGNIVAMSPYSLQYGGDTGVGITKDYIRLGSTTSIYTWIEKGSVSCRGSLANATLNYEGLNLHNADFELSGADFVVNTTNLKIYSNLLSSYAIETSKDVKITGKTYLQGNVDIGDSSYDELKINSKTEFSGTTTFKNSVSFDSNVTLSIDGTFQTKGTTKICDGTLDTLSFFGGTGSTKKTVSTITTTSSATASSNATKINEIINALKAYNLL